MMIPSWTHHSRSHTWPMATLIAAGVLGLAAGALWLCPPRPIHKPEREDVQPFISLQRPGNADMARDQSMLLDTAPMFLPTRWSTAITPDTVYVDTTTSELFQSFPQEIALNAGTLRPARRKFGDGAAALTAQPSRASSNYLLGRKTDADKRMILHPRAAFFEVRSDAAGDKIVLSGDLDVPDEETGGLAWPPAEFWVRVVQEGVAGAPLMSSGTGSDNLDAALRDKLAANDAIKLLQPGYYKVVVGP